MHNRSFMKIVAIYIIIRNANVIISVECQNIEHYDAPLLSNQNNYYLPVIPIRPHNNEIKQRLSRFVLEKHPRRSDIPNVRVLISPVVKSVNYPKDNIPGYVKKVEPSKNAVSNIGYYGQDKKPALRLGNQAAEVPNQGNYLPAVPPRVPRARKFKPNKRRTRLRKKHGLRSKKRSSKGKKTKSKKKSKTKSKKQSKARKKPKHVKKPKNTRTRKNKKRKGKQLITRRSGSNVSKLKMKGPVKKDGSEIIDDDVILGYMTDPRTVKVLSHQYELLAQLMRRQSPGSKQDVTFPEESDEDFKTIIKDVENSLKNESFYKANPFEGGPLTQGTTVAKDYKPINILSIGKQSILKSMREDPYIKRVMGIYNKKRKDYVKRVKQKKLNKVLRKA